MSSKIRVPQLPESVSDATIAIWIKKVGDKVEKEDVLLELETDKIILDVTAPATGILTEIIHPEDSIVTPDEVIGLIETESALEEVIPTNTHNEIQEEQSEAIIEQPNIDNSSVTIPTEQEKQDSSPIEIRQEILHELEQLQEDVPEAQQDNPLIELELDQNHNENQSENNNSIESDEKPSTLDEIIPETKPVVSLFGSPSIRKKMAENEIDPLDINGSGKNGKILKQDIEQHLHHSHYDELEHQQAIDKKEESAVIIEEIPLTEELPKEELSKEYQTIAESQIELSKAENKDEISDEKTINKADDNPEIEAINPVQTINELPIVPKNTEVEIDAETTITNKAIHDKPLERRVPMTRLRARIAERLVEAQQTAAILTTFNDVDLSEIIRLRKIYRERFEQVHGIKLGFMSFFVKAATEALKRYPEVNARIDGQDIVYQGKYDIGVAVSTERGLVVPVVRDTNTLGHAEIEKNIHDYAHRARHNQLEMDELTGGTFSITNGGVFGSMLSTPIINPPQSAILGMHKIEDRPVALKGEVVIRPMMYLALSYDHRLIDGKTAVSFLVKIKELLEDPASLFLEL